MGANLFRARPGVLLTPAARDDRRVGVFELPRQRCRNDDAGIVPVSPRDDEELHKLPQATQGNERLFGVPSLRPGERIWKLNGEIF